MGNNALNIRSKRALLQLIKKQLDSIFDLECDISIKKLKKLKKDKVFQAQTQWIDGLVKENFKEIPIVKHKLYTKNEIIKRIFKNISYYLLLVFALYQGASVAYFKFGSRGKSTNFLFVNTYTLLITAILLIGLYVYVNYYPGLNIEKMRKSRKIPIFEYERFLLTLKKKIESMSEKEIYEILR